MYIYLSGLLRAHAPPHQVFSTCGESCNCRLHVTHHQNCRNRKRNSNLGVWSFIGRKSSTRRFPRCDSSHPNTRYQGESRDCFFSTHLLILQQIQSSGQRIEHFNNLQLECGIKNPLVIPLHGNTRWGTAHGMLDRSNKLRQVGALLFYILQTHTS